MRQGKCARWALRQVGSYRRSAVGRAHPGGCRFEPSCSHFAEEALRTRSFPVAVALTAWRIVRCNPLATPGRDPVRRARNLRPRRNGLATTIVFLAFGGMALILATQVAYAQSLDGGCTATINGRAPATLTKSDPLVVHKGEGVNVQGVVPPAIAATPADQITSQTNIKVSFVENLFQTTNRQKPGTGPNWGGSVNVDDYLKYGVGLYKVEGTSSGAPGGWRCSGDGFVKLDGSPLSKPVGQAAVALFAVAGVGALASGRAKAPDAAITQHSLGQDLGNDVEALAHVDAPKPIQPFRPEIDRGGDLMASASCATMIILFLLPGLLNGGGSGAIVPPLAAGGAGTGSNRVWVRGHPVLGFVSGLFMGLALAVLMQQFAKWTLTPLTIIAFPLLVAILTTARAWRGRPFRVRRDSPRVSI